MADQSDVQNALAALMAGALYPNGTGQPAAVSGIAGIRIYAGWPMAATLDADLRANVAHVSVYARGAAERNTTRYLRDWRDFARVEHTISATVDGTDVTLSGTVSMPQNIALIANGRAYSVAAQNGSTLATLAAGLATLVAADLPDTESNGAVISIPGAWSIEARVGGDGKLARILRNVEKQFQIVIWSPTPELRSAITQIIDPLLADTAWIGLADGTNGKLEYQTTLDHDETSKELLYRRDLIYSVDWPLLQFTDATEIVAIELTEDIDGVNRDAPEHKLQVGAAVQFPLAGS